MYHKSYTFVLMKFFLRLNVRDSWSLQNCSYAYWYNLSPWKQKANNLTPIRFKENVNEWQWHVVSCLFTLYTKNEWMEKKQWMWINFEKMPSVILPWMNAIMIHLNTSSVKTWKFIKFMKKASTIHYCKEIKEKLNNIEYTFKKKFYID